MMALTMPAVPRIWLLPLPPRLYSYVSISPYFSFACGSVSPTEAISGSQ